METLPLAPLPSENHEERRSRQYCGSESFIDEAVVLGVIARGVYDRAYVKPEGMVLSSSEEDYAGWALPVASPFRQMIAEPTESAEHQDRPLKRPAPPVAKRPAMTESGISEPHRGGHRWWVFGLSGAMVCSILSLMLLSLAQRSSLEEITSGYISAPSFSVKKLTPTEEAPAEAPALTSILTEEH